MFKVKKPNEYRSIFDEISARLSHNFGVPTVEFSGDINVDGRIMLYQLHDACSSAYLLYYATSQGLAPIKKMTLENRRWLTLLEDITFVNECIYNELSKLDLSKRKSLRLDNLLAISNSWEYFFAGILECELSYTTATSLIVLEEVVWYVQRKVYTKNPNDRNRLLPPKLLSVILNRLITETLTDHMKYPKPIKDLKSVINYVNNA